MSKLSIFKIEDASTAEYNAVRVELFPGTDPEDAIMSFKKMVFENSQNMLFRTLSKRLNGEDEWDANDDYTDCVVVSGLAERVAIKPHYRFTRDKKGNMVKASPEKVVNFVKIVAFQTSTGGGETIEGEIARYEAQIPDSCKIEDEGEE